MTDWPLSMSHLINTKLTPSTAAWRTAPIAEFASNADLVIESTQARRVYPGARRLPVPRSRAWTGPSIWSVLRRRRTVRSFSRRPIPRKLWMRIASEAAGVTGALPVPGTADLRQRLRAWPSAGALYPIELYAVPLDEGVYHFDPVDSVLEVVAERPVRSDAAPHVLTIADEMSAPLLFVLTGAPERTLRKYGERGYRYLWLDAGHLAQNLLLAAAAVGLGACPIGGFLEDELARALGIDARETILYLIAMGFSAPGA